MLRLLVFAALCSTAYSLSWNIFANWALYTSEDVPSNGLAFNAFSEKADFRIFAVTQKGAENALYFNNVVITSDNGCRITVAALDATIDRDTKEQVPYKCDDAKNLYITDSSGGVGKAPYVIYILKTALFSKTSQPIYSAKRITNGRTSASAALTKAAITVLSAEESFTMNNFEMGSSAYLEVYTSQYDSKGDDNRVMVVSDKSYAPRSVCIIYGPIATITMTRIVDSHFAFDTKINQNLNQTMQFGSVYSVSSPGYGDRSHYFAHPYRRFPSSIQISYPGTTAITVDVKGSFRSNNMHLSFGGQQNSEKQFNKDSDSWSDKYKQVSRVGILQNAATANFYVQVTSGSSLLSTISAVVAVCLAALFH